MTYEVPHKRSLFSSAGGKLIGTLRLQVPPQENEGVANHAGNHSTSIYYNINKIKDVLYKIESNSKLAKAQRVRTSNRSMFHD